MKASGQTIIGSAIVPFRLVFIIWLVFTLQFVYEAAIPNLGVIPRTKVGLIGIITSPLIHGDLQHLLGNTGPLLFLGASLFYFYGNIATRVFTACYLGTNVLVWIFARPVNHIGASGLIYGIAAFLIAFGLIRKDFYSLLISLIVMILYSSLVYGILPLYIHVSWESHLFGAITGVYCAWTFRKVTLKT